MPSADIRFRSCASALAHPFVQLVIYATDGAYETLHTVKYEMFGGPAFIWSCAWSADASRLAVGCWNSRAYLYEVRHRPAGETTSQPPSPIVGAHRVDDADKSPHSPLKLTELAVAVRDDRVYAVSLDKAGTHIAVGGRDKKLALYSYSNATGKLELLWQKLAEDFVYAVALSDDMQYCTRS